MTVTKKIRVAHCGLGQWGPNLLRNLGQSDACEVVAICDRDEARLSEFGAKHPGARLYSDVSQVAGDAGVHAVVLATPAGLHAKQTRMLLDAGKDVLVEKPLAMDIDSARELVDLARKRGRLLMVGHTFLFNEAVRRVKQEIDRGTLGDLRLIQAERLSLGRIREDCNALWNLAPHDVSILLYWLGEMPHRVSARGFAFHEGHAQEDYVICVLEFPRRLVASIQVSWMNPVKIRKMTLVGSQCMLVYDDVDRQHPLTLYHQRIEEVPMGDPEGSYERFKLEVRAGKPEPLTVADTEPLRLEIGQFLEAVRTRALPPGSGEEALRIMSVLDACDRSLRQGGANIQPTPV